MERKEIKTLTWFFFLRQKHSVEVKIKPDMLLHICNPSTQVVEAGGPQVPDEPWLYYIVRPPSQKSKQTKLKEGEGEGWGGKGERGGQRGREEGGGGKRGDWHTLRTACEHNFKVRRRSSAAHTSGYLSQLPSYSFICISTIHTRICVPQNWKLSCSSNGYQDLAEKLEYSIHLI
jgi:hypothetical protein